MNKLPESKVLQFSLFGAFSSVVDTVPIGITTFFLTNDLLLTATLATAVLFIAALMDQLIALVAGVVIQRSNLKWGKYRSWIVILRWVIVVASILLLVNTSALPIWLRITLFLMSYLAFYGSLRFTKVAHFMLITKMAGSNMNDRMRLSIRNTQALTILPFIISLFAFPISSIFIPNQFVAPMFFVHIAYAVLFLVVSYMLTKVAKAYDMAQVKEGIEKQTRITVADMLRSVFLNRSLMSVLVANIFLNIAIAVNLSLMVYYCVYVMDNINLMETALLVFNIAGMIAVLFVPSFGKKIGKKKAMVFGLFSYGFLHIGILLFVRSSAIAFMVLLGLSSASLYLFRGFRILYILDSSEYDYWKTGKDNRAVAASLVDFPAKIGVAIGGIISATIISSVGFLPDTIIDNVAIQKFMISYGSIPAICAFAAMLLMKFGYQISDTDAEKYVTENTERTSGSTNATQTV